MSITDSIRKKRRIAPNGQETPMSSNLPNLSGSTQNQGAESISNSAANEQWNEAYRQLHDRS